MSPKEITAELKAGRSARCPKGAQLAWLISKDGMAKFPPASKFDLTWHRTEDCEVEIHPPTKIEYP